MTNKEFITLSLENHLFFARIMKEHAFFIETAFTKQNEDLMREASEFKKLFEHLLYNTIILSNGKIDPKKLESGQFVTNYTAPTEIKSEGFTASNLNNNLTNMEINLQTNFDFEVTPDILTKIADLNNYALPLIKNFAEYKTKLLNDVLECKILTFNYPLLIKHILREANMYHDIIYSIQNRTYNESIKTIELTWNRIMMEHALFIRGLLDPTEKELITTADKFAYEYEQILKDVENATEEQMNYIIQTSYNETLRFRDFKEAGTKGILDCKIKSIIIPLLADHVLREANHYLNLLEKKN